MSGRFVAVALFALGYVAYAEFPHARPVEIARKEFVSSCYALVASHWVVVIAVQESEFQVGVVRRV